MTRPRKSSAASEESTGTAGDQELGSMYDYLAKIILLGPSGSGKSCLLHRFVKNEWRILSSQTIGVEFASKIIKVGTGARRKRIKLQLWDTAGTERFRSVSRSYYRGAAGAILVYDITSHATFRGLSPFLNDAPMGMGMGSLGAGGTIGRGQNATVAPDGREVSSDDASRWASTVGVPVVMETSAFTGEAVDEIFARLARMILTKIELGDIDPDDPMSGIQYGDGYGGGWNAAASDGASIKSSMTAATLDETGMRRRKGKGRGRGGNTNWGGLREWEEVFTLSSSNRRRGGGCC
ncbi:hypothetical protein VdG1_02607 [Verticillium dahliae VDG1]|nr:hypothetical protein VdG1_02607 [Verticillium dahliae VDG1]